MKKQKSASWKTILGHMTSNGKLEIPAFVFNSQRLTMKNSQTSVIMTPILQRNITFNTTTSDWYLKPCSETVVYCKAKLEPKMLPKDRLEKCRDDWGALDMQRSDTLYAIKSLIAKPSMAYRQKDGTYAISIINPLSKMVKFNNGMQITDGNFKQKKFYKRSTE